MPRVSITADLYAAELRELIESQSPGDGMGQPRISELREQWDGSEQDLRYGLVELVENGEVRLFPIGDVAKVGKPK